MPHWHLYKYDISLQNSLYFHYFVLFTKKQFPLFGCCWCAALVFSSNIFKYWWQIFITYIQMLSNADDRTGIKHLCWLPFSTDIYSDAFVFDREQIWPGHTAGKSANISYMGNLSFSEYFYTFESFKILTQMHFLDKRLDNGAKFWNCLLVAEDLVLSPSCGIKDSITHQVNCILCLFCECQMCKIPRCMIEKPYLRLEYGMMPLSLFDRFRTWC